MPRSVCHYCGLPVYTLHSGVEGAAAAQTAAVAPEPVFCCYGCSLASRIVGTQEHPQQAWQILRLSISALLSMNVMMLSLLLYTGSAESESVPTFHWILLALSTPAMILTGYPFAQGAWQQLRRGRVSIDTLIFSGSFAAYAFSAASVMRGSGQVYFDTATMLPALVTFGKLIEATAKTRAGSLMRSLETLLPAKALRLETDGEREVDLGQLRVGDRVRVRPGERLPVDGVIIEGSTTIEQAAFTGEPEPFVCGRGDAVLAGTVNGLGAITIEAQRVGEDLLLHRIVEMVEQAKLSSAPSERLAERLARVFVPAVFALALAAGVFWTWHAGLAQGGLVALAVLVVACPCALGIATPLATALAVGRAAREGVLVRGGDVLERVGRIGTVFFDKTGTITLNEPAVVAVETCAADVSDDEVLGWAASLEASSEHGLGRAIVSEARRRGLSVGNAREVQAFPGEGIRGMVSWRGESREVLAGSGKFIGDGAVRPAGSRSAVEVAWAGQTRGRVLLRDSLREDAAAAVAALRQQGVSAVLLSGDGAQAAAAVAREVAIPAVHAPSLPEEKMSLVRNGGPSAMVGDGINDAPALAAAEVGIVLGAGTDLARQAGNVILLSDRLMQIPWLIGLSRYARRIIAQNLTWAFGYNLIALSAAAAGWLHPLIAAVAMVVSSVTVLSNSLRIHSFEEKHRAE